MTTNIIAYLYTTFAYQSAVMHLLVGQANFDAQQLNLREQLPITMPANTNLWRVPAPPDGITTHFATSNYIYQFEAGQLISIQNRRQQRTLAETGPSLIDTNGAYQLATQWLAGISVDVAALDAKYPHHVGTVVTPATTQLEQRGRNALPHRINESSTRFNDLTNNSRHPLHELGQLPLFRVTWSGNVEKGEAGTGRPNVGHGPVQAAVEILGSTKQCLSMRVNRDLLTARPLRVTNAEALIGPLPPPQHFVEELLGGPADYNTVAAPDHVYAWLLGLTGDGSDATTNRTTLKPLAPATATQLSHALTDFNAYTWMNESSCAPMYAAGFRFTKGANTVDMIWNPDCNHVQITSNGKSAEKDCEAIRAVLLRAIQSAYPTDDAIKNLSL